MAERTLPMGDTEPETAVAPRAMWSAIDAAAAPGASLLITAALVRTLSPEDYGLLVIALAASGLSLAVNPAIAATTTKFVSETRGRKSDAGHSAASVITASLIAAVAIDLVLLAGAILFRDSLAHLLFGARADGHPLEAGSLLILAVLAISIQQVDAVVAAAIRGMERFRRQALLEIGSRIVLAACVTAAAGITSNVQMVLLAQCVACAASALVRAEALRRLLPGYRLFALPGRSELAAVLRYGSWMWGSAIAGVVYFNADRVIVGRVFGAAAAGQLNVYVQLAQLVHFIPSSLFAFSFPAFSRLAGRGKDGRSEIVRSHRAYWAFIVGIALAIALFILVWRTELLTVLAGRSFEHGQDGLTLTLLVAGFFLLSFNVASYYLLLALGGSRPVSLVTTGSMLVALISMAVLIPRYGLAGAAMARLVFGVGSLLLIDRGRRILRNI